MTSACAGAYVRVGKTFDAEVTSVGVRTFTELELLTSMRAT